MGYRQPEQPSLQTPLNSLRSVRSEEASLMPIDILQAVIPAAFGLGGVAVGGWITHRNQKIERRQHFIREQLSELYAPMLGYRERLKASGDVRSRVRDAA